MYSYSKITSVIKFEMPEDLFTNIMYITLTSIYNAITRYRKFPIITEVTSV